MIGRIDRNLPLVALSLAFGVLAAADAPKLETRLNERLFKDTVTESGRSAKTIFNAYLQLSDPPKPFGSLEFNLTSIWPGMQDWKQVSDWAAANEQMGEALMEAEKKVVLGMPYGTSNVERDWRVKGVVIDVAPDGDLTRIDYPYLVAMDGVACWATAEFYRLLEAGQYEKAFDLGLAFLRVLRQGCEQEMLEEKLWFMETLADALSTHRDAMYQYLDKIPAALFKELGMKEYPFLKPTDDQRMRRLEMPEGDRLVAEAMIEETFDAGGQADGEKFAEVFGSLQARQAPLTRFGTKRRWMRLSTVHASRAASEEKLTDVYDDWWRRWRMRQFDEVMDLPTEFERLNEIRYAAVVLAVNDLGDAFHARERLITNINGTMFSAGLCGYHATFGDWPPDLSPVYSVFAIKRFDFDPYNKDYGRLKYKRLSSKRALDTTDYGRVWVTGCLLYALGRDHSDDGASTASIDGGSGDLLIWPPTRQLAREEKLIE